MRLQLSFLALACTFNVMTALDMDEQSFLEGLDFISYEDEIPTQKTTTTLAKEEKKTKSTTHNHFYIDAEALILNSGLNQLEFGDRVF